MADSYIQVEPDSTGKKAQTFKNTIGADEVHSEAVVLTNSAGAELTSVPVTGTITAQQSNASNFSATVKSTNASNFLATVSGTVAATQSGDWNVKSPNASNFLSTISGTVTATQSNASNFLITATIPSLPVNSSFNLNQVLGTTVDVNSGTKSAGTQRVVIATDQPQLTNKLLVTPDANSSFNLTQILGTTITGGSGTLTSGTQRVVLATDQPALTNKLLVTPDSNIAIDIARIQGQASVASVAGVLDVMERKRTGATGLSPSYISGRINTSTTTTIVAATCYLSSLHVCCRQQGAGWAMAIQDGTAAAKVLVSNFILSNAVTGSGNNPLYFSYAEPIVCTTGINVVTVGGTAGNVDYFATYWQ